MSNGTTLSLGGRQCLAQTAELWSKTQEVGCFIAFIYTLKNTEKLTLQLHAEPYRGKAVKIRGKLQEVAQEQAGERFIRMGKLRKGNSCEKWELWSTVTKCGKKLEKSWESK